MKSTTNIEAYVEWFNRLSYLVATEICVVSDYGMLCVYMCVCVCACVYTINVFCCWVQSDRHRDRAKLMDFFLDVALECKKLNNFNSFMAIAG